MRYPNNIKKEATKFINYRNRGMDFESLINEANEYYREKDLALIYKKPTPIGISKASYNIHGRVINEGYFLSPSTLDYNGLYKGTKQVTSFPLANIHPHQIKHIRNVLKHGGITFLLIKMNNLTYLLDGYQFINFVDNKTRKSIPYSYLQEKGYLIKEKIDPPIDYLPVVEEIYFKGEYIWQKN